jgi:hypothetical protein
MTSEPLATMEEPVAGVPATGGVRRLAKHTAVYAASDLVAKGGSYLLIPVLTRLMSQATFGTYQLVVVTIVPVLTIVASLGLGGAVTRLWFDVEGVDRKRFQTA